MASTSSSVEALHEERRASTTSSSASEALAVAHYKRKLLYRKLKVIIIGLLALSLLLMGCLLGLVLPATLETSPKRLIINGSASTSSAKIGDGHDDTVHFIDLSGPDLNVSEMHMRGLWFPFGYELDEDTTTEPDTKTPSLETTTTGPETTTAGPETTTSTSLITSPASVRTTPTAATNKTSQDELMIHKYWLVHYKNHLENEITKSQKLNDTEAVTQTPATTTTTTTQVIKSNVRQITSYPQRNVSRTTSGGIQIRPITTATP